MSNTAQRYLLIGLARLSQAKPSLSLLCQDVANYIRNGEASERDRLAILGFIERQNTN
jgi:hypothetical protein